MGTQPFCYQLGGLFRVDGGSAGKNIYGSVSVFRPGVNIAESHIAIHTWPEHRYSAVDVFTCGNTVDPEKAAKLITERLGAQTHSLIELRRGIMENSPVECVK